MGPLESPWSQKVMIHWYDYYSQGEKQGAFCFISKISLSSTFLTSGSSGWRTKTSENVENIKFSLNTQLNFMFSTCSTTFCCLSARGLEVSLHFCQSWSTVCPLRFGNLSTALGYCLTCTLQFRRLDWIFIFTVNTRQSTLFLIFNLFYHY